MKGSNRGRGRPKVDRETKTARIEGRVTNDMLSKFEYICESKGLTKVGALEYLIDNQYNIEKFLNEND